MYELKLTHGHSAASNGCDERLVPVHAIARQNMLWWALKDVDHFR